MKSRTKSAHQRMTIRKVSRDLFEEIFSALSAKIGCWPMSFDDYTDTDRTTFYTDYALLEDPADEQAFSVKARFTSEPYEDGVRFALELFVLSRQVQRCHRLPTGEEAFEMGRDVASGYLSFKRYTTKMETFDKGVVARNIKADLAKALETGGELDKAIEWARVVTRYNIRTSKSLWMMKKAGWQVNERSMWRCPERETCVTGGKVHFKFGHLLTPEQAIALQEAMAPVLKDIGLAQEEHKALVYDPYFYNRMHKTGQSRFQEKLPPDLAAENHARAAHCS